MTSSTKVQAALAFANAVEGAEDNAQDFGSAELFPEEAPKMRRMTSNSLSHSRSEGASMDRLGSNAVSFPTRKGAPNSRATVLRQKLAEMHELRQNSGTKLMHHSLSDGSLSTASECHKKSTKQRRHKGSRRRHTGAEI